MESEDMSLSKGVELRPVVGLTRGLPPADLESLTVDAIRTHRRLVGKADRNLPGTAGKLQVRGIDRWPTASSLH